MTAYGRDRTVDRIARMNVRPTQEAEMTDMLETPTKLRVRLIWLLAAVVCVAVAAPSALAKPPVKGGKAKVVKVQSVKKAAASSNDNLRAGLSNAYTQGCQNGTVSDHTMGGDNNNYEYYGDVCTVSAPDDSSLSVRAASDQAAAAPTADGVVFTFDNTDYEYYGSPSGS